jgi:hypothetical protein
VRQANTALSRQHILLLLLLLQMLLLLQEAPTMLLLLLQEAPTVLLLLLPLPQLLWAAHAVPLQINQLRGCRPCLINISNTCSITNRHAPALQRGPASINQRRTLLQLLQVRAARRVVRALPGARSPTCCTRC